MRITQKFIKNKDLRFKIFKPYNSYFQNNFRMFTNQAKELRLNQEDLQN